ncbi:MAG: isoprenyl transferase [Gammaproteobacteria bacterium]
MTSPASSDQTRLPAHVAVIMDGNGRWARSRGMPRQAGHRSGVKSARRIVEACARKRIGALSLFAFSSENWQRPQQEVGMLMKLMVEALDREVDELASQGVRLRFIGEHEQLPDVVRERMSRAEARTENNQGLALIIALSYGGRWDIAQAAKQIAQEVESGTLRAAEVTQESIAARLALGDVPDPDLLIRTGGESRISNFLLWNLAYSELYFTDCLWPAFDEHEFDRALAFFANRQRRFGRTPEQALESAS